jgi:hypothetical protein
MPAHPQPLREKIEDDQPPESPDLTLTRSIISLDFIQYA